MDELSLLVEGIQNKVKKLNVRNQHLEDHIREMNEQQQLLLQKLQQQQMLSQELQHRIEQLQIAKVLSSTDTLQARHKVNELLREVEKCYLLLNR
jgi:phosphoenolpyruvate carboxylase